MQKKSDKGCGIDIFKIQRNGAAALSIQPAFTVPSQTSDTIGQRGDAAGAGIATPGCTPHGIFAPLIPQRTDYLLLSPSNRHQEYRMYSLLRCIAIGISNLLLIYRHTHSATRTMNRLTGLFSPLLGTGFFGVSNRERLIAPHLRAATRGRLDSSFLSGRRLLFRRQFICLICVLSARRCIFRFLHVPDGARAQSTGPWRRYPSVDSPMPVFPARYRKPFASQTPDMLIH